MGLKKNNANSKSTGLTQPLFTRKSRSTKSFVSKKHSSQSSFPDKVAKANELLLGAKLNEIN